MGANNLITFKVLLIKKTFMKGGFVLVVGNIGNCTQWPVNCCALVSQPVYVGKGHKVSELHNKGIQNYFFRDCIVAFCLS